MIDKATAIQRINDFIKREFIEECVDDLIFDYNNEQYFITFYDDRGYGVVGWFTTKENIKEMLLGNIGDSGDPRRFMLFDVKNNEYVM